MLSADDLVTEARSRAGLDDFGGETFRVGLGVLVRSIADEAAVSEEAVPIVREQLVHLLVQRLRVEEWYRRHPEIEEQQIEGPVWVVGLPRTGTTALSNLLVLDPRLRYLRTWESVAPTPPPETATERDDPRIAAAEAGLAMMDQVVPEFRELYDAYATGPTENQDLLGMEMCAVQFGGTLHVPSYEEWLLTADWEPAFRYLRRVLKLLQWRRPPNRWYLKSPGDVLVADALLRVFPDARLVWTHRDPAVALASVCHLVATLSEVFSERVDRRALGLRQLRLWSRVVERGLEHRRACPDAFVDVYHADLVVDPLGTVERLYADLGLDLGGDARRAMEEWVTGHQPRRVGAHSDLGEWGLDEDRVHAAFTAYRERFPRVAQV